MAIPNPTAPTLSLRAIESFWSRVTAHTDGCWEYARPTYPQRYSRLAGQRDGKTVRIAGHRYTYFAATGIWSGQLILHTCDNTLCVNPLHLYEGDNARNSRDMVERGRSAKGDRQGLRLHPESRSRGSANGMNTKPEARPKGERNGFSKLTEELVRYIRARYDATNISTKVLAAELGLSPSTVQRVVNRKRWVHVA